MINLAEINKKNLKFTFFISSFSYETENNDLFWNQFFYIGG